MSLHIYYTLYMLCICAILAMDISHPPLSPSTHPTSTITLTSIPPPPQPTKQYRTQLPPPPPKKKKYGSARKRQTGRHHPGAGAGLPLPWARYVNDDETAALCSLDALDLLSRLLR